MDLKPGEVVCDKCNGSGEVYVVPFDDPQAHWYELCSKCKGCKKLDWIERIIGVREIVMIPF